MEGYTYLYVYLYDKDDNPLGTLVKSVSASRLEIDGAIIQDPETGETLKVTYDGTAHTPEPKVVDFARNTMRKGLDYTVTYQNNIKTGVATALVYPAGDYKGDDPARAFFIITPPKASLTGVTAGIESLNILVKDQKDTGISGYEIQYREKGSSAWKSKKVAAGQSQYKLSGLTAGKQYEVMIRDYLHIPNPGEYYFDEDVFYYYGDLSNVITSALVKSKLKQPMTVTKKLKTVKLSKVKKKKQVVKKAIIVKNAKGTITYTRVNKGSSKYLTINKKTGNITVKKGIKKGTYKIKVKVSAAGNSSYQTGSKTVTVRVKVK